MIQSAKCSVARLAVVQRLRRRLGTWMPVGGDQEIARLAKITAQPLQIGIAQRLMPPRSENALDIAYPQSGHPKQHLPVGAIDVDRETLAMVQCPCELGIDRERQTAIAIGGQ